MTSTNLNFERLYTLEFTSDRKRMSTIIRDPIGQIWLYTKGAESHVLPLCKTAEDEKPIIDATQRHVDDFAKLGLRTLAIGRRKMKLDEFRQFYEGECQKSSKIEKKSINFSISSIVCRNYNGQQFTSESKDTDRRSSHENRAE